ncbi:MAG: ABC transporter ATP-binding protein/permease [Defluviitaleaceae bacterium]|nr:ABC transporter ATP-binding protein/permease [Defluviitaleaceae bacterium]
MLIITISYSIFNFISRLCFVNISQKSILKMRNDVYLHILKQPYKFFIKNSIGDVMSRIMNDVENVQENFSSRIVYILGDLLRIIFVLAWLFYIDFNLTLITIAIVPVFVICSNFLWGKVGAISAVVAMKKSEVTSTLQETISSVELVKIIANNRIFKDKLNKKSKELADSTIKVSKLKIIGESLGQSIIIPYIVVIYLFGGFWYMTYGTPSIGTIIAFSNFLATLVPAVMGFIGGIMSVASSVASVNRIQEYLSFEPEESGKKLLSKEKEIKIEFVDVSFYQETSDFKIENLNLTINQGDFITIVGETGSGKSTIVKLLFRLYDVDSGSILINGVGIKEYDINDLRSVFGYIQQDSYIFKDSIINNLLYGNLNATQDEINEVIKISDLHNYIEKLPDKYDTIIEERGSTLSGGEKQRLAIARALLRKPKLLVLDESTSSLDLKTEETVLNNMNEVFDNTTILSIDHRLTTLKKANKIIVINHGNIVNQGSYEELKESSSEFNAIISRKIDLKKQTVQV